MPWLPFLHARWQHALHWLRALAGPRPSPRKAMQAAAPQRTPARLPAPEPLRCATVVIPALNEAERIAEVVRHALADAATAEVLVIDDSSTDDTARLAAQAGARVITSRMLGKGASMRDGCLAAAQPLVVYLDGDLHGLRAGLVSDLCRPLVRGEADFVKARFGRSAGRVTELTAKPMLQAFFPELAHLAQPLGGLIAARRELLQSLPMEDGYGVDIGLLIDAQQQGARLAEVDIGTLAHDSQSLADLALMAIEVSRVIFDRARRAGRLHIAQISALHERQRQALGTLDFILSRRRARTQLLLIAHEDLLTAQPVLPALARACGRDVARAARETDPAARAALFRFVSRAQLREAVEQLSLRPGAVAWVNQMRRAGFMVGLLSEDSFELAELLRRRVFADFALASHWAFEGEVCTGAWQPQPAFLAAGRADRAHALPRLRRAPGEPALRSLWVLGAAGRDAALLAAADQAIVLGSSHGAPAQAWVVPGYEALLEGAPAQGRAA